MQKRLMVRVVRMIALLGVIDLAAFFASTVYLGGDAFNGYQRGNHYFLGLHSNGPFREVSRQTFVYSEWHAASCIVIVLFVLIAAAKLGAIPDGFHDGEACLIC